MRMALERFLTEIKNGENLDLYITMALSIILAVLGVIGLVPFQILASAILTTLALVVYSTLVARRASNEITQLLSLPHPAQGADAFLKDRSTLGSFADRIRGTSTIWLCGPSLVNIVGTWSDHIFERVRKGGDLRILVVDPGTPYLNLLTEYLDVEPALIKADIRRTIIYCKELVHSGIGQGKLEMRLISMNPGYSMVITDPTGPYGEMIVEYIGYHSFLHGRPHLELKAARDGRWFAYYLQQFEALWNSATPCALDDVNFSRSQ
jgi:hypothetical protein